jgi:hypothetical protein
MTPGCDLAGPNLGAGRIDGLHALSGRSCRTCQGACLSHNSTRDLGAPRRQIISDLKRYGHKLNAPKFTDFSGKNSWPASSLAPEDRLQSPPLPIIGPFVDEEAHPNFGFVGPDIAFESSKAQQVETVESDIAVVTLADMPSKHACTFIVGGRLSKFARTRNVTAADVEPIASEMPFVNGIHRHPL